MAQMEADVSRIARDRGEEIITQRQTERRIMSDLGTSRIPKRRVKALTRDLKTRIADVKRSVALDEDAERDGWRRGFFILVRTLNHGLRKMPAFFYNHADGSGCLTDCPVAYYMVVVGKEKNVELVSFVRASAVILR